MTLEKVFQFVEAKESGKRSASQLINSQGANATSSYRRSRIKTLKTKSEPEKPDGPCTYCGTTGQGTNAPRQSRKKLCPALSHICEHCDKPHHFAAVCRSKLNPRRKRGIPDDNTEMVQANSTVFESLCSIHTSRKVMKHHLYNRNCSRWERRTSAPQPSLQVKIRISPSDYETLGQTCRIKSNEISCPAIADTGCQSCLSGMQILRQLGMRAEDLIPVAMKMHAANNLNIEILGAIIARISGTCSKGDPIETRQIVYVTDTTDKLFLSKQACMELGILPDNFPSFGEAIGESATIISTRSEPDAVTGCDCPRRQAPPSPPSCLPFQATEDNRSQLKEFLKEYYKSSTFNTCKHQQLPMMSGPALELMVDPDATPVAHHTPVPVPLHWQDDVKAGLDQDTSDRTSASRRTRNLVPQDGCVP